MQTIELSLLKPCPRTGTYESLLKVEIGGEVYAAAVKADFPWGLLRRETLEHLREAHRRELKALILAEVEKHLFRV